ncbi:MAG: recombinase family protein [Acidobacteria bacterium]|nr:recombinase family protein [Acidobacteriota bacterium]
MAAGNGIVAGPRRSAIRCGIYTRKSTEEGLQQEFNTLDAQRDAAEAFIRSQRGEGWVALPGHYDDGGFTGANMDRPALQKLLQDVRDGLVDCVMVYKVDRLTRSLLDFTRIMEVLDKHGASFVSVTQQFNTTSSLGRLTLNILLSFAQFEREMIAERTKDKMSAARRKGRWVGGIPMLGYDLSDKGAALVVNEDEAARVRAIFDLYLEHGSLIPVVQELNRRGWCMKEWTTRKGTPAGGQVFMKNRLYNLLTNMVYVGKIEFGGQVYDGEHQSIVDPEVWQRVQDRLRFDGKTGGRQIRNKYGAVLKGILLCGSCQAGMIHTYTQKTPSKLYRYYVCVNAHQKGYNACQTRSVSAPVIEQAVVDQIRGIAANPTVVDEVVRQLDEQRVAGIEALEREKRVMEKELQRLGEEIAGVIRTNGKLATDRMAELQERVSVVERQLREVRDQLAESVSQTTDTACVRKALRDFDALWSEMTSREQEKFVKTLVERVTYDGATGTVTVGFRTAGIRQLCLDMRSNGK